MSKFLWCYNKKCIGRVYTKRLNSSYLPSTYPYVHQCLVLFWYTEFSFSFSRRVQNRKRNHPKFLRSLTYMHLLKVRVAGDVVVDRRCKSPVTQKENLQLVHQLSEFQFDAKSKGLSAIKLPSGTFLNSNFDCFTLFAGYRNALLLPCG